MEVFQTLSDWSEVWALLIPLTIFLFYKPADPAMRPVILYLFVALVLNSMSTTMYVFYDQMPASFKNNNLLYNFHSIARVIFFCWYIGKITPRQFSFIHKTTLLVYLIFVLVNFLFFESPLFLSSRLFAAESVILLFLCLSFFFRSMQDESGTNWISHPSFLVCTGISFYEAITFFIFLFIYPIAEKNPKFGMISLEIYKITYIVFCILLAIALYRSKKQQPVVV